MNHFDLSVLELAGIELTRRPRERSLSAKHVVHELAVVNVAV